MELPKVVMSHLEPFIYDDNDLVSLGLTSKHHVFLIYQRAMKYIESADIPTNCYLFFQVLKLYKNTKGTMNFATNTITTIKISFKDYQNQLFEKPLRVPTPYRGWEKHYFNTNKLNDWLLYLGSNTMVATCAFCIASNNYVAFLKIYFRDDISKNMQSNLLRIALELCNRKNTVNLDFLGIVIYMTKKKIQECLISYIENIQPNFCLGHPQVASILSKYYTSDVFYEILVQDGHEALDKFVEQSILTEEQIWDKLTCFEKSILYTASNLHNIDEWFDIDVMDDLLKSKVFGIGVVLKLTELLETLNEKLPLDNKWQPYIDSIDNCLKKLEPL